MQYQVIKQHFGDQQYFDGDIRVVNDPDHAKSLIDGGLIAPIDTKAKPKAKAKAETPENKAETPENKAETVENKADA